jgi:hypothetical protein
VTTAIDVGGLHFQKLLEVPGGFTVVPSPLNYQCLDPCALILGTKTGSRRCPCTLKLTLGQLNGGSVVGVLLLAETCDAGRTPPVVNRRKPIFHRTRWRTCPTQIAPVITTIGDKSCTRVRAF